jgi:hypothetical protein
MYSICVEWLDYGRRGKYSLASSRLPSDLNSCVEWNGGIGTFIREDVIP